MVLMASWVMSEAIGDLIVKMAFLGWQNENRVILPAAEWLGQGAAKTLLASKRGEFYA